jgi:GST-like protein
MSDPAPYTPPPVWTGGRANGGRFANINRPTAGSTHEKALPVGRHPLQLYSLGTPNGVKVTVMLEELLALGHGGAEYDAWLIRINDGEQFGSGFVAANPNSKIPVLVDRSGTTPIRVFESGAILLHLAEKFGALLPADGAARAECLSWLFWQMGAAPFLGGGFGHFYAYAPSKIEYAIDRYAMEVKRQLDVLDRRLGESRYLAGRRVHDRRHRRVALVRHARQGPALRRRRVPPGAGLRQRLALDRRGRAAAGGAARPHGQSHLGPAVEPAARAPRRQRFRDAHRRQARAVRSREPQQRVRSMITLYDCSTAPSPRRARILLAEKGVAYDTVEIDLRRGEQLGDAFRAINPQCTVPVLRTDDGLLLTDNAAITAWLEARFPEPPVLGVTPAEKAEIASWTWRVESEGLLAIAEAMRNSAPALAERALAGPVNYAQIPELAQRGQARARQFFATLDERLAGREFLAGGRFSVADITAVVAVDFARIIKLRIDEQVPELQRWRAGMALRPAMTL